MNFNKKGIESYILIILIVSFIVTILITTLFSSMFVNDHQNCQYLNYEITNKKKIDSGVSLTIKNTGNNKINFQFNGENNLVNTIYSEQSFEFKVQTKENKLTVIPLYLDAMNNPYECKGKKKVIDTTILS